MAGVPRRKRVDRGRLDSDQNLERAGALGGQPTRSLTVNVSSPCRSSPPRERCSRRADTSRPACRGFHRRRRLRNRMEADGRCPRPRPRTVAVRGAGRRALGGGPGARRPRGCSCASTTTRASTTARARRPGTASYYAGAAAGATRFIAFTRRLPAGAPKPEPPCVRWRPSSTRSRTRCSRPTARRPRSTATRTSSPRAPRSRRPASSMPRGCATARMYKYLQAAQRLPVPRDTEGRGREARGFQARIGRTRPTRRSPHLPRDRPADLAGPARGRRRGRGHRRRRPAAATSRPSSPPGPRLPGPRAR